MEPSPQKFAELLSAAIYAIKKREQRWIKAIQDELGMALGYSGGDMIEHWRKPEGHIPPLDKVIILARVLKCRAHLDDAWVEEFLGSAGYVGKAQLVAELGDRPSAPAAAETNQPTHASALPVASPELRLPQVGALRDEQELTATDLSLTEQRQAVRDQQNRRTLLQMVRNFWIQGVLEDAVAELPPLALPLATAPSAVTNGWHAIMPLPAKAEEQMSATVTIQSTFAQMQQSLLILGEPGAGKTTLLLMLAQTLLAVADTDPCQPIPVVFNLATWSAKEPPLEEWLVDELQSKYQIPKRIGHPWIFNDEVALLLDGLDEVAPQARGACIAAINEFVGEHLVPVALCCRTTVYQALPVRLILRGAVEVQPLSPQQVDAYFGQSTATMVIGRWLAQDQALRALSTTPLMLNIMRAAYQQAQSCAMPLPQTAGDLALDERRRQLFTAYLTSMTSRRVDAAPFTPAQTTHWLAWLARQMNAHSMQLFMVEALQPSWLEYPWQRYAYAGLAALIGGLTYWLMLGLIFGPASGALGALLGAALFFIRTQVELARIKPAAVLRWSWTAGRTGLLGGMIFGALAGLGGALSFWLVFGLIGGQSLGIFSIILLKTRDERRYTANHELLLGLLGGVICGALYGFRGGVLAGVGSTALYCTFYRPKAYALWISCTSGLLCGLIGALLGELSRVLSISLHNLVAPGIGDGLVRGALLTLGSGAIGELAGGLLAGLFLSLFGGLLGGLVHTEIIKIHHQPNQGIHQSGVNALKVGSGLALLAAVAFLLINGLVEGMLAWWQAALSFGLLGGLSYGGFAYLLHYGLRAILWRSGSIPWRYAAFLDHAADQILLRKVGTGYIFIHRLLLEHLAEHMPSMKPAEVKYREQRTLLHQPDS